MSELSTSLRNQLGRVIVEARRIAEAGAKRALESLAVGRHEPHGSMSLKERGLRVRLRAHGRQLGDVRDRQRGSQSIGLLTHEVAYEHWHRMLFARFLTENGLLIHPEHEVAMSVRDIEELALETGRDPHQLAAGFAQNSLPQIFRTGDPVLEVTLAPETRQKLETLLDSLPTELFTADDSLGWTYQYWQAEKKDAVNASGEKIGADELPAVTQLFTEHYMVMFLYHNTLGAWHAGKVLADDQCLAETAQGEDELRRAVALKTNAGDSNWDYLRFIREPQEGDDEDSPTGPWRPASGTFMNWPKTAKELKILDPCCGSGHFLVAGFKLLTRLRILEEGLSLEDAITAVLEDNLFGLELDPRCTQIAAFNLALNAWRWVGKSFDLPALSIACSGLSIGSSRKDWLALAADDERLESGLANLYELFRRAPELGSLIDPHSLSDDMFVAKFEELQPLLQEALAKESANEEAFERAVAAQGMAKAAELLTGEHTLVITNVPYLARGKQSDVLKEYADARYKESKADLSTMFVERILELAGQHGSAAMVTPQNWLFLTRYRALREKLLNERSWHLVGRLGSGAFETISGAVVNVSLPILSALKPRDAECIAGIDASDALNAHGKAIALSGKSKTESAGTDSGAIVQLVLQSDQLLNADARIDFRRKSNQPLLSNLADTATGIQTFDRSRFILNFWEVISFDSIWVRCQSTVAETCDFGGMEFALRWEGGKGQLAELMEGKAADGYTSGIWRAGSQYWGHNGVLVSLMGELPVSLYGATAYDQNAGLIVPNDIHHLSAIWAFARSGELGKAVRQVDQALKVTNATLAKIPFDLDHWQKVAKEEFVDGLPEPYSNNPSQWLFHGHPAGAEMATALQVAVGCLLGYRWPAEIDTEMRLSNEALEWAARCNNLTELADDDGIVCLPAIRSERPAADRLRSLMTVAFGSEWSITKERELLAAAAGDGNRPARSLEDWLRDKFFEEHCKLFHHRPFIWHIWDGNRDGFHCLVNAHNLAGLDGEGRRTLEAVTYSYLGDWIQRQKDDQKTMLEGADARLAAAKDLQQQLVNTLRGEPPYDIFVRWKPLHEQAVGWDPDINDGIRLNIRPFMCAELRKGGKKGAGILRWKPNINWKKDRGKEPESLRPVEHFPWFWGCDGDGSMADRTDYTAERAGKATFDGNRWNDLHYSRAVKEAAHAAAKDQGK